MQGIDKTIDNMNKQLRYKSGGHNSSNRYKKYQYAGVYGQNALNMPPPQGNQQFRTAAANEQAVGVQQNVINEAQQDGDQAWQEFEMNTEMDRQRAQLGNAAVGAGLTGLNKAYGMTAANAGAQTAYKGMITKGVSEGLTKAAATEIANNTLGKPMARGLLGTGTASVGMSNAINVGSLVGTLGGTYLENKWSDDDATTYTTKEGIAGALKTGSTWAGYGNMILPGVGGLIGGAAGVVSSIFTGRGKAKDARDEEARIEKEYKNKVTQAKGRITQLLHKGKQQVGAMMGNRNGGPRVYADGGVKVNYETGGAMAPGSSQEGFENTPQYKQWLKYMQAMRGRGNMSTQNMGGNMAPQMYNLGGVQQMEVPEEQMVTMQQYQQPMMQQQPSMQQQPFQVPMSDNLPYMHGGLKRY
tara:strand:- start:6240 stop:7478 length:1239 start_codon:yes stop_codon:yes gene_type:complete